MATRKGTMASQEKFSFSWSVPAAQVSVASIQPANPEGYFSIERSVEEEVAALQEAGPVEQAVEVPLEAPASTSYPEVVESDMTVFHSSPKSKSTRGKFASAPAVSPSQMMIGSLGAWSVIAASGAVLLAMGPGPAMALHLEELGGVWAGIAAALWLIPSKFM